MVNYCLRTLKGQLPVLKSMRGGTDVFLRTTTDIPSAHCRGGPQYSDNHTRTSFLQTESVKVFLRIPFRITATFFQCFRVLLFSHTLELAANRSAFIHRAWISTVLQRTAEILFFRHLPHQPNLEQHL